MKGKKKRVTRKGKKEKARKTREAKNRSKRR